MTQPKIDGVGHGIPRMLYASDGSNWYAVLVDSDGHVKIDVVSAALPTGAATATNQATMITALQLIDDLRNALGSVNTDDLQVDVKTYPGSNALGNFPFGYYDTYQEVVTVTGGGVGDPTASGSTVPTGEVWVVTHIACRHDSTASLVLDVDLRGTTTLRVFGNRTLAQYVVDGCQGVWVLKAGHYISADFVTLESGKIGYLNLIGYKMKIA